MRAENLHHKQLQHELKTEFHAYFEAIFAHEISKTPEDFHSLRKVSRAILEIISANEAKLTQVLNTSLHVESELLSPKMHGHLVWNDSEKPNGKSLLNLFIQTLKNERADLSKILLLHGFFIYRLYDHCANKMNKEHWANTIFRNGLFSERRREATPNPDENKKPGIIKNSTLAKRSKVPVSTKNSPKDQFKMDESSPFIQKIQAEHLPIACNVSGHTGSLLLGAMLYGGLSKIELSEYLLAAFSFLTLARAHTFHEVMAVGETVGLPFSYSDYATSLPEKIREYRACRHISQLFPQYLPGQESSDTSPTAGGLHASQ